MIVLLTSLALIPGLGLDPGWAGRAVCTGAIDLSKESSCFRTRAVGCIVGWRGVTKADVWVRSLSMSADGCIICAGFQIFFGPRVTSIPGGDHWQGIGILAAWEATS